MSLFSAKRMSINFIRSYEDDVLGRFKDITDKTNRTSGFARLDAGWQFGVVLGPIAVGLIMLLSNNNLLLPFIFIGAMGLLIGILLEAG